MSARPSLFLLSLLALGGCDAAPAPPAAVVATALPRIEQEPTRTITIPDSIGGASADMGRAVLLADNAIAIGDWDGSRVLVFDSLGALQRIIGRRGSGPREFQNPVLVQAFAGESLLIWDAAFRRVARLSARSGGGNELVLDAAIASGSAPIVGWLPGGDLLLRNETFRPGADGATVETALRILDSKSGRATTIVTLPPVPNGDTRGYRFFSPRVQVAVVGAGVVAGYPDRWEVAIHDRSGRKVATLTRPWRPRNVTEADRTSARSAIDRPDLAPGFADDERFDPTWPAFGTILPGPRGTTWVLDYAPPFSSPDSVTLFAGTGSLLGVLPLPAGLKASEVAGDRLIGTARTPDGDLVIRIHRITWP